MRIGAVRYWRRRWLRALAVFGAVVAATLGMGAPSLRAAADSGAWSAQSSGTTADLLAVSFPDAAHGHAVGSGGTILATADAGRHWAPQYACALSSPCLASSRDLVTRRLLAVDFVDALHGWAAGDAGTILATTDGGRTWTSQLACAETSIEVVRQYCNPLSADHVTVGLHGLSFVDPLHGWAVGGKETILVTADGGRNWVEQIACLWDEPFGGVTRPCPPRPGDDTPRDFLAVSFVDAEHGMAVGTHGRAAVTGDGGQSWARAPGALLDLRAVTMLVRGYENPAQDPTEHHQPSERQDTTHAVGVGDALLVTGLKGTYWYGTGGSDEFTSQPPASDQDLNGVAFADRLTGIAVGDGGTIERTRSEGAVWRTDPSGTQAALRGVALPDANDAYAVGDGGVIRAMHTVPSGLAVTSVSPRQLPTSAQLPVTIAGSGFTGADEVNFGTAWARGFTVDSDRQITAMPPPLPAGPVHVTVTNHGMTSAVAAANAVTYVRPGGGTWTSTGQCPERCDGPAVLLRDGRVLIEGGHTNAVYQDRADTTPAAELYDPASGRWTPTAPMHMPRLQHTATVLRDGRVLVVGGWTKPGSDQMTASAEIYDPATGRWTLTGSMHAPRFDFAAVLLPGGRVLVAGGGSSGWYVSTTAELYDPATGRWSETGSMHGPRIHATLLLLRTGKVLVIGNGGNDPSAELYDPGTGRWTETGGLEVPRSRVTATVLQDGRVLVAGGRYLPDTPAAAAPYSFAEIYDPTTGSWRPTGPMVFARVNHAAVVLPDGRVVVVGGANLTMRYCPPCDPMSDVEIYDPAASVWSVVTPMHEARGNPTAVLLADGGVLVTGEDGASETFHAALTPAEAAASSTGWVVPLVAALAVSIAVATAVVVVILRRRRRRRPPGPRPRTPPRPWRLPATAGR